MGDMQYACTTLLDPLYYLLVACACFAFKVGVLVGVAKRLFRCLRYDRTRPGYVCFLAERASLPLTSLPVLLQSVLAVVADG